MKGQMKSLYICRKVLNKNDIVDWAKSVGFTSILPEDDLHVTVVYCKDKVDWNEVDRDQPKMLLNLDEDDEREMHLFDGGACVLEIKSPELKDRNTELAALGIKSKHPEYRSHITLTYQKPDDLEIDDIVPYRGPIIFGPEKFEKIKTGGWSPGKEQSLVDEPIDETVNIDIDHAYDLFEAASRGKVLSRDQFLSRAHQWRFFGDLSGYVAIKDRGGMNEAVGVAGTQEGILRGLCEASRDGPTWGMVSDSLARAAQRSGFIAPHLMESSKVIGADTTKYLIGNKHFFDSVYNDPVMVARIKEHPGVSHFLDNIEQYRKRTGL